MSEGNILVVEDDESIARTVELELLHAGYSVERASDGDSALLKAAAEEPDLVVLDLMLPGIDGLEVARILRERDYTNPILMLTARADTPDVVAGFDAGADDYLRKPFEMQELLSRVSALLKRHRREEAPPAVLRSGGLEINMAARTATLDNAAIDLTAREFDLLAYLVEHAGHPVTRDEIAEKVWGGARLSDSNVIEVFMCHLRGKLGRRGSKLIKTIRGVGYFFARN